MSHEVETMAWTNEKPWHGLGHQVDGNLSAHEMMVAAKLDWSVSKRPLYTTTSPEQGKPSVVVKGQFALTRDSDNHVLDVVGSAYTPTQNEEAFEFFREFVEAGSATMETAGSLRNGQRVWGLANLGQSFKLAGKDEVKGYLLVSSPHEQGKAMQIMLTTVRVVCNNTLTMALRGTGSHFRMAHRRKFDAKMIEQAKVELGIAREQMTEFETAARLMSKVKVSEEEADRFLARVFQPDLAALPHSEILQKASTNLKRAKEALTYAPGATMPSAQGTVWGLVNAVTYTTDHLMGRTADRRLDKAWFGKVAQLKRNALQDAVKIASR